MRKALMVSVAIMLILGLTVIAYAEPKGWGKGGTIYKGIFETPMVIWDEGGKEVQGSECKILRDGSCKIEIPDVGDVEECYVAIGDYERGPSSPYFQTAVAVYDGKLKVGYENCNIGTDVTIYYPWCFVLCDETRYVNGMTTSE